MSFYMAGFVLLLGHQADQKRASLHVHEGVGVDGVVQIGETKKQVEERLGPPDAFYNTTERVSVKEDKRSTAKLVRISRMERPKYRSYFEKHALYVNYSKGESGREVFSIDLIGSQYVTSSDIHVGTHRDSAETSCGMQTTSGIIHCGPGLDLFIEGDTVAQIRIIRAP